MSYPKFLNVEKRVPYNVRLPKRLIDKLNSYAELTGNTTTNILNNVLDDFLSDKIVVNDYLDNIGGVSVKIPYTINQKIYFINNYLNLKNCNSSEKIMFNIADETYTETYFAELFEIKKIPNNLDIYNDNYNSYIANKSILKHDKNAIHSGIELFIYNITETIFADSEVYDKFDSFINCLYCLYFEVTAYNDVDIYLIDYISAINLLSASGNDDYKDLIIAVATELKNVDNLTKNLNDEYYKVEQDILKRCDTAEDYSSKVERIEKELHKEYLSKVNSEISAIADKYNSNNIILFGSDIFSKLAIKEMKDKETGFLDEIVNEKVDKIFDEKFDELEKLTDKMNKKLDDINDSMIELKTNKTN